MVYRARRSCSPKSFLNKFLLPLILDTQFSIYDYNRNLNQTVMVTSCVIIKIKGFFFVIWIIKLYCMHTIMSYIYSYNFDFWRNLSVYDILVLFLFPVLLSPFNVSPPKTKPFKNQISSVNYIKNTLYQVIY